MEDATSQGRSSGSLGPANGGRDSSENVFLTEQRKSQTESCDDDQRMQGVLVVEKMEASSKQGESVEMRSKQNDMVGACGLLCDSLRKCDSATTDFNPSDIDKHFSNGMSFSQQTLLSNEESDAAPNIKGLSGGSPGVDKESFPVLEFPVLIDVKDDAAPTGSSMSCTSSLNAQSKNGSVQSYIERNKVLCSMANRANSLTAEEEERISEMLLEEEGGVEKYGFLSTAEEEREAELDNLLLCLGYSTEIDDMNVAEQDAQTKNESSRRDPILRELAEQREIEQHEKRIDQALRALMREPLPPVIRFPEEGTKEFDGTDVSRLTSLCGETTLTAPMTEDEIQELILDVKKELEADALELADHHSVRVLAQSIMNEESSKKSGLSIA